MRQTEREREKMRARKEKSEGDRSTRWRITDDARTRRVTIYRADIPGMRRTVGETRGSETTRNDEAAARSGVKGAAWGCIRALASVSPFYSTPFSLSLSRSAMYVRDYRRAISKA